jgi:hypothetical protein
MPIGAFIVECLPAASHSLVGAMHIRSEFKQIEDAVWYIRNKLSVEILDPQLDILSGSRGPECIGIRRLKWSTRGPRANTA